MEEFVEEALEKYAELSLELKTKYGLALSSDGLTSVTDKISQPMIGTNFYCVLSYVRDSFLWHFDTCSSHNLTSYQIKGRIEVLTNTNFTNREMILMLFMLGFELKPTRTMGCGYTLNPCYKLKFHK